MLLGMSKTPMQLSQNDRRKSELSLRLKALAKGQSVNHIESDGQVNSAIQVITSR